MLVDSVLKQNEVNLRRQKWNLISYFWCKNGVRQKQFIFVWRVSLFSCDPGLWLGQLWMPRSQVRSESGKFNGVKLRQHDTVRTMYSILNSLYNQEADDNFLALFNKHYIKPLNKRNVCHYLFAYKSPLRPRRNFLATPQWGILSNNTCNILLLVGYLLGHAADTLRKTPMADKRRQYGPLQKSKSNSAFSIWWSAVSCQY